MKKTANTLKYLMALFLFLGMGHHTFAQCTDDHGLVAFTGYQIGDTDFTTVKKDAFSFVVLDYLPAKTAIHFTDRGWLGNAFQTYGQATTDGQLTWSSDEAIPGGQHIVITLDGINSKASKGNITKYEGNFELGISGDQLFAYTETLKIHAAMLINRTAWDTDPSIQNLGYLSSSVSLDPNNAPRQSVIVANLQGSPAVDQENAFQAKLSPITIAGSRAALRTQLFAAPFTILAGGQANDIQLANSPITWNAALPSYSSMTLGNKSININGVINACYYQWQSSTDNVTFTDISESQAFEDTQKPNLSVKDPLSEDTWFRVILRGAQQAPSEAKLVKALKITTQPVDVLACANTNVSLKVEAVGEGNLKYQWKIRNRTTGKSDFISDDVVYSGTNTNTLILKAPPYSMNNYAYICVITDELGFSNESSEGVLTVSNLHATATVADVSCHGTATGAIDVTPAGGTAPYTYDWGNGTTTQDRVNLVAGSYTVTITDSKGCQYSLSATVTEPVAALKVDEPTLTAPTVYGATDGRIQITVSGGTAAYSYQWFKNGESTIIAITKDLVNIGAGLYSVVVTDAKGCQQKIDNVILTNPNAKPVVISSGGSTAFTEGQLAVVVDAGLTVTDPDNTTLATATVAITGNFQSGEDILSFTSDGTTMGNITTALYNKATGVLTLSSAGATATVAQWQAALRAVKYDNLSQNPSTANRTISFKVHDSDQESVAATKTVSVIAVNDAPVAVDDYVTLTEDIPATGNVLTNDSDPEGNALTVSLVIAPVNGMIVLNADGSFTYTPKANYAGRDSLQYQVCDNGVPSKCGTAWLYLTVNPVNDAPVVSVPTSIAVTEDVASALTGISFSDVDAGANPVTVTLSVPTGTLRATSGMGITVGGTAAILTLSGSVSTINAFVAAGAVTFTTASNATSNVTLTVSINDNGHTGGTALSDTKTIALVVTAVNDAPVNSVPGTQSVDQDAILVFSAANNNQISVSDVDAGANAVQVALTATNGLITLSGTSGLSVSIGSGTNDVIMIFNGTLADINNALNGLIFEPTPGYNGPASLQITTDDLGNTGSGGRQTATNTIAITVKPINPKIVSVGASTADGTYKIGDDIKLVVTFDQTVMVNTEGGIPTLLLETGAIDRMSTYVSGNGSNTLTFIYTVQAGDRAPDLDYQSTSALSLNGASIKNSGGNDAVLTLPAVGGPKSIAGQHAIVIDGVRPTVASVALPANGYYVLNQNLDFTVNFSEAVVVNTIGGTPGLSLTIGGQTAYANYLSGSGSTALEFRYVVINDLEDHDGITVSALSLNGSTISDAAGNDANLTLNSVGSTTGVKVDAKPPAVPAGFKAIGQHAQISLTWESNTEADLTKYMLYVKPEDEARLFLTDIAKGTEYYTHAGLVDGKTYEFFLVAVDQVGNRSLEAQASAKTMAEQSINFAALPDLTYGQQAVVLTAAATSNLPVSFVSSDVDIAEVYQDNNDGGKWKINVKKTGKVQITAIQGGDQAYLPAAPVVRDLTIMKAEQTIRFIGPDMLARDAGQVSLDVSASSGLPVVLSVDDPSVATVSGTQVKVLRLGTVRITATQPGNENYAAAAPVTVTVRIANDAAAPLPIRVHQALSPNGDGVNDFLTIEGIQDYPENKVTIFDKSGSVLAEIASYNNRDRVFSGNDHRDGTYFYYIDVKDNSVWKREKGYFVIRR
ncbi:hypothetical protein M472_21305 [Sphingobacterium paucimobilis HER1398]|uniref:Fibronectin type-III domain-containing protein n=2 Tax=Sphingobacterium TaxID=28453 RepID=U2I193_9SPHI|nr:hypothetical protein M472_21305 [Sphingobacterium paucimobilis HER1398]